MQRRSFLKGCCAAIAAMSGARLGNLVFAQSPSTSSPPNIIINLFLRGGMDSLSFLVPWDDTDYHTARPRLGLGSAQVLDLDGRFGLHPSATQLKELYDSKNLGLVCATGSPHPTRSHFEAQDYLDHGVPGDAGYSYGGWLARYLARRPTEAVFSGISVGSAVAVSLSGFPNALSLTSANGFSLSGSGSHLDDLRRSLRAMWAADPQLATVGLRTLDAVDIIDHASPGDYAPPQGITYPSNSLGDAFKSIAQMIRLDLGLQGATVDLGGWDTHESQASSGNPTTGQYADQIASLSATLGAFWNDLSAYRSRITVVVMSEFGRRLRENDNRGTDHGHGSTMMVLSDAITEKKVYGTWPGLATDQLFESVDLAVTTDYRTILAEILQARLGINNPAELFPGFSYPGPLGMLTPIPAPTIPMTGIVLN
ncbi:DUF1501 domain-containing protein [bacterium]|nr:DUF1501 domain-containing protein [bacterium]